MRKKKGKKRGEAFQKLKLSPFVKEEFRLILCSLETIGIFYPMLLIIGKIFLVYLF
jgi:hypothetical protein